MKHPTNNAAPPADPIIILVDNKVRDLDVAALIAHQVEALGVQCHLEPLEAFRGVLAAYRPGMIVFNHLNASHMVAWSRHLAKVGVLTAVLPNEGIAYDPEARAFLAGRYHNGAHIDYFFCWNEAHREALVKQGFGERTRVEVTGVPRFDFYFEPWSRIIRRPTKRAGGRPKILFCTNFIAAKFLEIPRQYGDNLFKQWSSRVPLYADYWTAIEAQGRARSRAIDHLDALVAEDAFDIVLRPHPSEDASFYAKWFDSLPLERRAHVRIDSKGSISSLILDCDLEISCETCTTALESWIADKPTIELDFDRHPLWYREIHARGNVACDDPAALPALVRRELRAPAQPEKRDIRRQHLAEWCATPDGNSSERIARLMVEAVRSKQPSDWNLLDRKDYRRALKLWSTRLIGEAYHYNPLLPIKQILFKKESIGKATAYRKSIKPRDVAEARSRLNHLSGMS